MTSSKTFDAICGVTFDRKNAYFFVKHNGVTLIREEIIEMNCCMYDPLDRNKRGPLSFKLMPPTGSIYKIFVYKDD